MSEPFVVEVWGKPAGFVLKEGKAFRFHALDRPFAELDGTEFNTLGHARLAAAAAAAATVSGRLSNPSPQPHC